MKANGIAVSYRLLAGDEEQMGKEVGYKGTSFPVFYNKGNHMKMLQKLEWVFVKK